MREYNELSGLWRVPMLSRGFFQDVALRWRGIGMRYLMLILALTWLTVLGKITVDFSRYINGAAVEDLKDFPSMTLAKGKLSSPVPQPYVFSVKGSPLFVLDTTGEIKRPGEKGAPLLITETEFIQEQPGSTRNESLAAFPDMTVDSAKAMSFMRTVRNWLIPLGFPLLFAFSIVYRLLAALIVAAIGLAIAAGFRAQLSFPALLRLAIVSFTPVLLLDTVFLLAGVPTACWSWIVFPLVTLGYFTYGVKVAADLTREAPPAFPVQPPAAAVGGLPVPPETDRLFP